MLQLDNRCEGERGWYVEKLNLDRMNVSWEDKT